MVGHQDVGKVLEVVVLYLQKSVLSRSFVRKQGHWEHPELALCFVLELVSVGELALRLGEDAGGP